MPLPSKKIMIPMAALALIGAAGAYGISAASADTSSTDPRGSLIQKLADTFHLDKNKVQAVFDADREEQQAKHEQGYQKRLEQAVTDGKLTSAQKDAVLAEHNKLAGEMKTAMQDQSADKRDAMKKIMDEGKTWADQNNVDPHWLMGMGGMGHGHHGFAPGGEPPMANQSN